MLDPETTKTETLGIITASAILSNLSAVLGETVPETILSLQDEKKRRFLAIGSVLILTSIDPKSDYVKSLGGHKETFEEFIEFVEKESGASSIDQVSSEES